MPPLNPYKPNTPQPVPAQLGQTGVSFTPPTATPLSHTQQPPAFSHPVAPVSQTSSVDYDWIVGFCYKMIAIPRLLFIAQIIFVGVLRMSGFSLYLSAILNHIVQIGLQSLIFFVGLQLFSGDRNYKKVLLIFLLSVIVMGHIDGFISTNISSAFYRASVCSTVCDTNGSSCKTSCK